MPALALDAITAVLSEGVKRTVIAHVEDVVRCPENYVRIPQGSREPFLAGDTTCLNGLNVQL